jgi:hypothetical protein
MPTDPCNENFAGGPDGIDNDGDGLYDMNDPDCQAQPPSNTPPVADAGPDQTVAVNDTVALDGSGSNDGDGDPLTFSWSLSVPGGSGAALSDTTAVSPTFVPDVEGTYTATLIVNDGMDDSTPDSVDITAEIVVVNTPPVADAGPDQTVAVNDTVALDGSGSSDDDGDPLTFSWSLTTVPVGSTATLSDTTAVSPSFVADVAGDYVAQLIVNDGTEDSNAATVSITVTADTEPPPPTGDLSVSPEDGTIDVPVTTVVTVTNGSSDISTVVNPDTFTLMEDSPVAMTSSYERDDDDDHSPCVSEGIVLGNITYNDSNTVATFTPDCPLKESTTYTATITPEAGVQQSVLDRAMAWSFTTIAMTPDSDDDGDPDDGDESPNDCRNATPGTPRGKGKIKMNLDGHPHGCFKNIKARSETDPSVIPTGMPPGYEFRDGIIAYEIVGISTGETDTVTLTYPEAFPAGSKVYKADSIGFHEYPDADIDGNTVTLKITDGGDGDSDSEANGVIVDPVGVAVPTATGGGSIDLSTDAAGGGCSVVGSGGGWKEAAESYGLLVLVWLGLALRRKNPETGK